MNWKYIKPLESESSIKEFEEKYSFEFPESFRDIVSEYNGAYPETDIYDTDKTKERTFKSLLSFNREDKMNIWKIAEWNSNELDNKYIAFATDQFGNLICFSISDKSVVFMDMETLSTETIAENFSCFLDKLYTID